MCFSANWEKLCFIVGLLYSIFAETDYIISMLNEFILWTLKLTLRLPDNSNWPNSSVHSRHSHFLCILSEILFIRSICVINSSFIAIDGKCLNYGILFNLFICCTSKRVYGCIWIEISYFSGTKCFGTGNWQHKLSTRNREEHIGARLRATIAVCRPNRITIAMHRQVYSARSVCSAHD